MLNDVTPALYTQTFIPSFTHRVKKNPNEREEKKVTALLYYVLLLYSRLVSVFHVYAATLQSAYAVFDSH